MKYNIEEIVQKYSNGQDTASLAREYGTYNTTIRRFLIREGIKPRTCSQARSLVKANPFSLERSQYWLGLLATDGCITRNKIILDLHKQDRDILEKYIAHIAAPLNLNVQKSKQFGTANQLRAEFSSAETIEFLENLGITRRKSKTLEIKFPISWDFLRGVIDGDGCVHQTNKNTAVSISIATASSKFLDQIKEFLDNENIHYNIFNRKDLIYILSIQTKEAILKCYYNLYSSDDAFMKRKHAKFGSVIQKWITKDLAKTGKDSSSNPVLASSIVLQNLILEGKCRDFTPDT